MVLSLLERGGRLQVIISGDLLIVMQVHTQSHTATMAKTTSQKLSYYLVPLFCIAAWWLRSHDNGSTHSDMISLATEHRYTTEIVSRDPIMIYINDFLRPEESAHLVNAWLVPKRLIYKQPWTKRYAVKHLSTLLWSTAKARKCHRFIERRLPV